MLFDVNKNDGFDIVKMFGLLYYRSFSVDTSQPLEFYLFIPSMITEESLSFREVTVCEDAVRCKTE